MSQFPTAYCSHCRSPLHDQQAAKHAEPATYKVGPPYSATYSLWSITCPICRTPIQVCSTSYWSRITTWNRWHEMLVVDDDYTVILRDGKTGRLDGRRNMQVCWPWLPLAEPWPGRVLDSVIQNEYWREHDQTHILLLPPQYNAAQWMEKTRGLFGEVWQLKDHVMDGATGPYPSLRAERSIQMTFGSVGLVGISYHWPACTLPSDPTQGGYYHRVTTDDNLTFAWAAQQRRTIDIRRPVDHKSPPDAPGLE